MIHRRPSLWRGKCMTRFRELYNHKMYLFWHRDPSHENVHQQQTMKWRAGKLLSNDKNHHADGKKYYISRTTYIPIEEKNQSKLQRTKIDHGNNVEKHVCVVPRALNWTNDRFRNPLIPKHGAREMEKERMKEWMHLKVHRIPEGPWHQHCTKLPIHDPSHTLQKVDKSNKQPARERKKESERGRENTVHHFSTRYDYSSIPTKLN